jgi:hypothetical protein
LRRSLARPALPVIEARLTWPGTLVCVVGARASELASELAAALRERGAPARTLRVELTHAEGSSREGDADMVLRANPDALEGALAPLAAGGDRGITIGAGLALAAAARPELLIWIRAGQSPLGLAPQERALLAEAHLVLEDPRGAAALADALLRAR